MLNICLIFKWKLFLVIVLNGLVYNGIFVYIKIKGIEEEMYINYFKFYEDFIL